MIRFRVFVYPLIIITFALAVSCGKTPHGEINWTSDECLYMEFLSPSEEHLTVYDDSGKIESVITPIERKESLILRWQIEDFDKAVMNPQHYENLVNHLPGKKAWNFVKGHLEENDEVWTFGFLDTGFVIIRNGKLFCIVVTEHMM